MKKNNINKLKSIKDKLSHFANEIDEIILEMEREESEANKIKLNDNFDVEAVLESLKKLNRDEAFNILKNLKQKEVSLIFTKLGGASRDQKKKKDWLVNRILWELFDFKDGHNILLK